MAIQKNAERDALRFQTPRMGVILNRTRPNGWERWRNR